MISWLVLGLIINAQLNLPCDLFNKISEYKNSPQSGLTWVQPFKICLLLYMVVVAQLVRAPDCDSGGRRFKSG